MDLMFFVNSVLFGIGLAMDAFSVSLAQGLNEPNMRFPRECGIAGTFAVFQTMMPLLGWFLVRKMEQVFSAFQLLIPWAALALLLFIGGKMLYEGLRNPDGEAEKTPAGFRELMILGVATSIDALSVGLTIADYSAGMAITEAGIIGSVTLVICLAGLKLGRKIGTRLAGKASILGGVILILIGIEIFIKGMLT